MFIPFVLGDFLYFPQDKSEYIPAVISLTIFMIGAAFAMVFFIKHSKREAQKSKELENKIMNQASEQKEQ
jgi:flagellar basal body-associated protein FliL